MKRVQGQLTENTLEVFGFETLSSEEMTTVRGGVSISPKSRPKDMWPDEDED